MSTCLCPETRKIRKLPGDGCEFHCRARFTPALVCAPTTRTWLRRPCSRMSLWRRLSRGQRLRRHFTARWKRSRSTPPTVGWPTLRLGDSKRPTGCAMAVHSCLTVMAESSAWGLMATSQPRLTQVSPRVAITITEFHQTRHSLRSATTRRTATNRSSTLCR